MSQGSHKVGKPTSPTTPTLLEIMTDILNDQKQYHQVSAASGRATVNELSEVRSELQSEIQEIKDTVGCLGRLAVGFLAISCIILVIIMFTLFSMTRWEIRGHVAPGFGQSAPRHSSPVVSKC
jgi:hypothetical protein